MCTILSCPRFILFFIRPRKLVYIGWLLHRNEFFPSGFIHVTKSLLGSSNIFPFRFHVIDFAFTTFLLSVSLPCFWFLYPCHKEGLLHFPFRFRVTPKVGGLKRVWWIPDLHRNIILYNTWNVQICFLWNWTRTNRGHPSHYLSPLEAVKSNVFCGDNVRPSVRQFICDILPSAKPFVTCLWN